MWIVNVVLKSSVLIVPAIIYLLIVGAGPVRWIAAVVMLGLGFVSGSRSGGCIAYALLCGLLAATSVIVVIGWDLVSILLHFVAAVLFFVGGWLIGYGMLLGWLARQHSYLVEKVNRRHF